MKEAVMGEQERKVKKTREKEGAWEPQPNPEVGEKGKKLKEDIDKLLDEIDQVLEENAEEFVKSYVQRGGQ